MAGRSHRATPRHPAPTHMEYAFRYRDREELIVLSGSFTPHSVSVRRNATYVVMRVTRDTRPPLLLLLLLLLLTLLYYVTAWRGGSVAYCTRLPFLLPLLQIEMSKFPRIPLPLLPATTLRLFTKIHTLYYACIRPIPAAVHIHISIYVFQILVTPRLEF